MVGTEQLRNDLAKVAPELSSTLFSKAEQWTASILQSLDRKKAAHGFPKTFNDPIWGVITLYPWETLLLDSPLLQRLRGVRQLGMAHHVYPGASHDRLEHSRGVVEASERMLRALKRNAEFRRQFGIDRDENIPEPSRLDEVSMRLAALLHDVGHSSFSHATESLLKARLLDEFSNAEEMLRKHFEGVTSIASSEVIAVFLILSEPMQKIFEHPRFEAIDTPSQLPVSIAARILGSRSYLNAGYLSGIISGPLDADKLDYMARDSHHAGLPLGLDLKRLISKLEVVTVTSENAPNPELRERAEKAKRRRFYELGISLSGLGAYEQMIIGRVILYDRIYYHHKVRSAEAMVRRLIMLAEEERSEPFTLSEMFYDLPDDTTLGILGGKLKIYGLKCGAERSATLADAIQNRQIYYRAFAFAPRFITGLSGLAEEERRNTIALIWGPVLSELSTIEGCKKVAQEIYEVAKQIQEKVSDLAIDDELYPEHILVDLPVNRVVVRGCDILTRTEDGQVAPPNLFFDPVRWSQAYEHQKQCGFVFTQRQFVRLVSAASRIVFFDKYQLAMDRSADRASKTAGKVKNQWFAEAAKHGICTNDCAEAFSAEVARLIPIRKLDLENAFPKLWQTTDPQLISRLTDDFNDAIPVGLPPKFHKALFEGISHLASFLGTMEKGGDLVNINTLDEKTEFQTKVRDHLRARDADVQEGAELGGGKTDLVLSQCLVIENKVIDKTTDPFGKGEKFAWQARRYSIPICSKVAIVVVAYRPKDEFAILPLSKRFRINIVGHPENEFAELRCVIPWGYSVPSGAKPVKPE